MKALHLMKKRSKNNDEAATPRKKKRIFRRILFTVVILLIATVLTVQYGLGFIVRKAAKTAGPAVIGTEIKISKAYVRPFFGIVDLGRMVVGPPNGFKANVFEMENFRIVVDTQSVFSDTLIIKEIAIINPHVSYELSGLNSNISAILDKLGTAETEASKDETDKKAGKKVIIESLIFSGAKIRIAATAAGGKGIVIPMPDLVLKDIGKQSGGVTALAAFGQALKSISHGILNVIKNAPFAIGGLAIDGAKAVGGVAMDGARATLNTATAVGGAAADGAKAAGNFAVDTVSAAGSATLGAAGSAGKAAVGAAGAVGGAVADGATTAGQAVVKNVKAVGGAAADTVGAVGGALLDGARTIGEATIDTASAVGGAVVGGVKTVGGATLDTAGALGGAAVSGVKAVGGAVTGGAKAVGGAVVGIFASSETSNAVPEKVEEK